MSEYTLFPMGRVVVTTPCNVALEDSDMASALQRHQHGDWGDCCPEDKTANDDAVKNGDRLVSVYHAEDGTKFWIITERDRSYTTILLPEDY